jgi:hypothetical protein
MLLREQKDKPMTLETLKTEYAPYHTLAEFEAGFQAYAKGSYDCPKYDKDYKGQAWDRGLECASRWNRLNR